MSACKKRSSSQKIKPSHPRGPSSKHYRQVSQIPSFIDKQFDLASNSLVFARRSIFVSFELFMYF